MESMEDQTMKLSGLPPFPQSLEIAKERRLPHSHRTTTTDISTLQRYGHLNFAATESQHAICPPFLFSDPVSKKIPSTKNLLCSHLSSIYYVIHFIYLFI
jgi:hypothetical protein